MLKIYCDGACSGNPGPGGWAFIIPKLNIEISDYKEQTTNNRMEITAVMKALEYLLEHFFNEDNIEIITDSQYVINTMTKGWQKKKNTDLWGRLDNAVGKFNSVTWTWIKGHADNKYNKKCDELAVQEYKNYQQFKKEEKLEEEKRELAWYGKRITSTTTINNNQKVMVEFVPYEIYDVGRGNFVTISKCTALQDVFCCEANNKELLSVGAYNVCRQALQNYKLLVDDNFKKLPF